MIIYYLIEFIILDYSNTDSASESDISTVVTKEIIDVETKSETNLSKSTIFNYKYEINKLEKKIICQQRTIAMLRLMNRKIHSKLFRMKKK